MKKILITGAVCVLLTGCAGTDLAAINKNISDTAFSVSKTLRGGGENPGNGMPVMTKASTGATESVNREFSLPVGIDTAAARLKRHYGYVTPDEIAHIRNKDRNSRWAAAAIEDSHPVWEAVQGSSYRMGSDVGDNDHMEIELEKNGAGTRAYITYQSPSASHLTGSAFEKLMTEVKQVASGKVR